MFSLKLCCHHLGHSSKIQNRKKLLFEYNTKFIFLPFTLYANVIAISEIFVQIFISLFSKKAQNWE